VTVPKRDFLLLTSLTLAEARQVLDLARTLKAEPKGTRSHVLRGRSVAIVMEKASTRTRVSFEVGVAQLGAHPVVLGVQGSQLGRGEPIEDTARVLSRYCDAIVYRTFGQQKIEDMARWSRVPVVNALTDDGHPVQVLCDVLTVEESLRRPITGLRVAWVGDGSSNMARSWLEAAELFGFHLSIAAPEGYMPPKAEVERALARGHGSFFHEPAPAIAGAHVVNTDVWASMGQESEVGERMAAFEGWTLTDAMLAPADPGAIVLHCLPAHRGEEISAEVLEGPRSRVWDQAENRLHVQKALLLFLLGEA
jgi:ornithine carbamoyltransferase